MLRSVFTDVQKSINQSYYVIYWVYFDILKNGKLIHSKKYVANSFNTFRVIMVAPFIREILMQHKTKGME